MQILLLVQTPQISFLQLRRHLELLSKVNDLGFLGLEPDQLEYFVLQLEVLSLLASFLPRSSRPQPSLVVQSESG